MTETEIAAFAALAVSLGLSVDDAWDTVEKVAAEHPDTSGRDFALLLEDHVGRVLYPTQANA